MLLRKRVLPRKRKKSAARRAFVFRNHLLSAAAVSGQRKRRQVRILFDDPRLRKRRDKCAEAACVTSRNGDTLRGAHLGFSLRRKLRKAVAPSGSGSVRGRCVENNRIRIPGKSGALTRRVVGEAEKRSIRGLYRLTSRLGVMSDLLRQGYDRDIAAEIQPVVYSQPGRTAFSVDEYLYHSVLLLSGGSLMHRFCIIIRFLSVIDEYYTPI